MRLQGKLLTVKEIAVEEVTETVVPIPTLQIEMADGRRVTVTGLARDEASAAAVHLDEEFAIDLAPAHAQRHRQQAVHDLICEVHRETRPRKQPDWRCFHWPRQG